MLALTDDADEATRLRELLKTEGAEEVDAARHQWWTGLRSAEHEHYTASGRNFSADEKYYRLGFENLSTPERAVRSSIKSPPRCRTGWKICNGSIRERTLKKPTRAATNEGASIISTFATKKWRPDNGASQ